MIFHVYSDMSFEMLKLEATHPFDLLKCILALKRERKKKIK